MSYISLTLLPNQVFSMETELNDVKGKILPVSHDVSVVGMDEINRNASNIRDLNHSIRTEEVTFVEKWLRDLCAGG